MSSSPGGDVPARLAEMRRSQDSMERRIAELTQVWAAARVRRAQLRGQRLRLRADMQLRRAAGPRSGDRSEQRAAAAILEAALTTTGVGLRQLWLDFVAFGGSATFDELSRMIAGEAPLGRSDHDRIALALNERMEDAGYGRPLAYWDGFR